MVALNSDYDFGDFLTVRTTFVFTYRKYIIVQENAYYFLV